MTPRWHRPVREGVISALIKIFNEGFYADKVIHFALKENRKWGSRDRRLFAEAVYDIVRWWRKLLAMAGEPWPSEGDQFAPVRPQLLEKIVNIWSENRDQLPKIKKYGRPTDQALPNWLDQLAEEELGIRWENLAQRLNEVAPVFLRVNLLKTDRDKLIHRLREEGYQAEAVEGSASAVRLRERANVFKSKVFLEGWFEVQDLHSQHVAEMMQLEPGQRVIDACAGAGGKTLHIASLLGNKGKILAMDIAENKLAELQKRSRRAGASAVEIRPIASTKVIKRLKASADRVLLDVPCSGLGVLRRNPDSKWKLQKSEVLALNALQAQILEFYSSMTKENGILVYATCSILPSENERQVERFLSQNENEWRLESMKTEFPDTNGGDGFFMARLRCLKMRT